MKFKITNSETELILSSNFKPRFGRFRRRLGLRDRYGRPGSEATGDKMTSSRPISFSFQTVSQNDSDYISALADIFAMFRADRAPYYLVDTDNSRRARIEMESQDDRAASEGTSFRIGEGTLELEMLDGYWEDLEQTIVSSPTGGMSNNEVLSVNNSAVADTYPVIEITPYQANSEFTITNTTTGSAFTLGSSAFVVGTTFIVSSVNGTVYLDDGTTQVELSSALSDGSGMIKLIPGVNNLRYESSFGDVDVDVKFRKRFVW